MAASKSSKSGGTKSTSSKKSKAASDDFESQDSPKSSSKKSSSKGSGATKKSASSKSSGSTKKSTSTKKSGAKGKKRASSKLLNWIRFTAAFLLISVVLCIYLFDISRVTSNAMMPTLAKGDIVLSWAPAWVNLDYKPGTVALLEGQKNDIEPNFLRVISTDHDEISFNGDRLSINGKQLERLKLTNDAIIRPADAPELWRETLPGGAHYRIMLPQKVLYGKLSGIYNTDHNFFLAGDNRMASYDSRQNGLYPPERVTGKAILILKSVRNDGLISHLFKWID